MSQETRFRMVEKLDPERFKRLLGQAEREARQRYAVYQQLAGITIPREKEPEGAEAPVPARS
jgi:pyruvate-ferredoxin/flavodoxin oxidoreductase